MYNDFKNDFISDLAQMDINLNKQQMSKILAVLDGTANKYDILNRNNRIKIMNNNGIPQSVYDYIHCKKSEGLTSETLYIYRIILEIFFHTVNKPPEYIEASDIMDFLRDYQEKNHISNRTLDKYRQYICCYFEFIHDYGYIQRNPAHQVKKIKYEVKPMPVLTEYEVELIREACITRREKAIIEFFLSTACRVSELIKVKKSDINWETDEVILFGKGSKYGTSFITPRCKLSLQNYLKYRDEIEGSEGSEYLFIKERYPYTQLTKRAVENIIDKIMMRITDINKKVSPHTYRRTSSTNAYLRGMNLADISRWLRHSSVAVTELYVRNNTDHVHGEHRKYVY